MPNTSVMADEMTNIRKMKPTKVLLMTSLLEYASPIFFRKGRTMANMTMMYVKVSNMVYKAPPNVPAFVMAMTTARRHHAVTSSLAAEAMVRMPIGLRVIFLSWMMRAKTGNAVMLMAMPMNKEKGRKAVWWAAYSSYIK